MAMLPAMSPDAIVFRAASTRPGTTLCRDQAGAPARSTATAQTRGQRHIVEFYSQPTRGGGVVRIRSARRDASAATVSNLFLIGFLVHQVGLHEQGPGVDAEVVG